MEIIEHVLPITELDKNGVVQVYIHWRGSTAKVTIGNNNKENLLITLYMRLY